MCAQPRRHGCATRPDTTGLRHDSALPRATASDWLNSDVFGNLLQMGLDNSTPSEGSLRPTLFLGWQPAQRDAVTPEEPAASIIAPHCEHR